MRFPAGFSLLALLPLTGCIAVGYTSRGGFFLWPGASVLLLFALILFLVLRRR